MTTVKFTDQLAQWWAGAERGAINEGDTLIQHYPTAELEYTIFIADGPSSDSGEGIRILQRAPKSKPAWHEAFAVRARWEDPDGSESEPFHGVDTFVNCGEGWWTGGYENPRHVEELHDVTPLIEARITDDMIERVSDVLKDHYGTHDNTYTAEAVITAALGIGDDE